MNPEFKVVQKRHIQGANQTIVSTCFLVFLGSLFQGIKKILIFRHMMRALYACCILLAIGLCSKAQLPMNEPEYADSLTKQLKLKATDSAKARTNFLLSQYWSYLDFKKSKQFLDEGKRLSKSNVMLNAISYFFEGNLYFDNEPAKAEKAFLTVERLLNKVDTKESYYFRAKALSNYATLQEGKDDYKTAIDILLNQVIPLAEKNGNPTALAGYYQNLGSFFQTNRQYEKAETYYLKTIETLKNGPAKSVTRLKAYVSAANLYCFMKKFPQAKNMLDRARPFVANLKTTKVVVDYYAAEGLYSWFGARQFDKALVSFDKGLALAKKINYDYAIPSLTFSKYDVYSNQKNFAKALATLNELTRSKLFMGWTENRISIYNEYANTYAGMGKMSEAYAWSRKHSKLNDSLNKAEVKKYINDLEIKFKTTENQKKITRLEAEKKEVALIAKNARLNNWLLGSISTSLLIVTAFVIFYYRNTKKLSRQKEINHQQQLKEMEQQQRLGTVKAMLEGEEKERSRMARDLHDGLGGLLTGVRLNLSNLVASPGIKEKEAGPHPLIAQVDASIHELRNIAHNIMPQALQNYGLEAAIRDLCHSMMSSDLPIRFHTLGMENNLSLSVKMTIYRIIQEALSNAIRHAGASFIIVQCSQNQGVLFITIEDDGVGFSPETLKNKNGIGLSNIRNRVEFLKGEIEISSAPNEGTTINIELVVD